MTVTSSIVCGRAPLHYVPQDVPKPCWRRKSFHVFWRRFARTKSASPKVRLFLSLVRFPAAPQKNCWLDVQVLADFHFHIARLASWHRSAVISAFSQCGCRKHGADIDSLSVSWNGRRC